jgi:uncharacterized protein YqhQ
MSDEHDKLRLGGMALRNGLLVHGPTSWAAAVRDRDGRIEVASGRKPRAGLVDGVPGLRGVVRMAEAVAVIPLVKRALPAARLPFQNPTVIVAAVSASVGGALIRRRRPGMLGEAAVGVLSVAPALLSLRGGELAQYHGVEHKAIAAYEQDAGDAREADKEHDRCGSHLVAPLLAANVAGTAILRRVAPEAGRAGEAAVGVGALAAAVEIFLWSERHSGSPLARALKRPGMELQRAVGTREPTEEQLEVGRAALAEILRAEQAAA